jgi:hypothetical protein
MCEFDMEEEMPRFIALMTGLLLILVSGCTVPASRIQTPRQTYSLLANYLDAVSKMRLVTLFGVLERIMDPSLTSSPASSVFVSKARPHESFILLSRLALIK